jgi:hypothetical protein
MERSSGNGHHEATIRITIARPDGVEPTSIEAYVGMNLAAGPESHSTQQIVLESRSAGDEQLSQEIVHFDHPSGAGEHSVPGRRFVFNEPHPDAAYYVIIAANSTFDPEFAEAATIISEVRVNATGPVPPAVPPAVASDYEKLVVSRPTQTRAGDDWVTWWNRLGPPIGQKFGTTAPTLSGGDDVWKLLPWVISLF